MSNSKTIVILQSNYIPWKGYFDMMAAADEFLLFDEVQFTKNDWRNRNRIVLNGKLRWLTVPVKTAGTFGGSINDVEVSNANWAKAHWDTLKQAYRFSPHYGEIAPILQEAYRTTAPLTRLSLINEYFLKVVAKRLQLEAKILRADIVPRTATNPTDRLVEICKSRGATSYLSGPAARNYLNIEAFSRAGIALYYANYEGYPAYSQDCDPFEQGVSIVDTLMQCGDNTRLQFKSLRDRKSFLVAA